MILVLFLSFFVCIFFFNNIFRMRIYIMEPNTPFFTVIDSLFTKILKANMQAVDRKIYPFIIYSFNHFCLVSDFYVLNHYFLKKFKFIRRSKFNNLINILTQCSGFLR
jgi:hypothetical protein